MNLTPEQRSNYFTAGMKEWVFYREGMTPEEYEAENEYLMHHFEEYLNGTYLPMWKQNNA